MHSDYLRSCYVRNEFARGEFEIEGTRLDPGKVDTDTYVLAAVDDHIVPWTSCYKTTQLLGGKNRFVLSTSGHIAGIVNPPNPKAKHWVNDTLPADPHEWKANAQLVDATWWQDWTAWIGDQGGGKVAPPNSWATTTIRPSSRRREVTSAPPRDASPTWQPGLPRGMHTTACASRRGSPDLLDPILLLNGLSPADERSGRHSAMRFEA